MTRPRPRSGPLGPHLGPSGSAMAWLCYLRCGDVVEWLGRGAATSTACLLQSNDGSFTGVSGPRRACGSTGLVCSCCCVRSDPVGDVGAGPSRVLMVLLLRGPVALLRCVGPTSRSRGETTWEASRCRVVVSLVASFGAREVKAGIGRNPRRPGRH